MPMVTVGRDATVLALIGALAAPYNNANAALGVGDSTLATTAAMVDLQGASKARKAMDATFPTNPPTPVNRITARSTFGTADANFSLQEVGLFNSVTLAAGTMLSRVVVNLGTKTSASTVVLTYTLDLTI